MKKFEEELNNGLVSIGQNIITKEYAYGKDALINYFKDWHSDEEFQLLLRDRDTLKQGNDNLFKNNLELVRENDELKSQLEKQQPEIPEVPQFVADWYEENKGSLDYMIFETCRNLTDESTDEFENWFGYDNNKAITTLVYMKNGYTVESPKVIVTPCPVCGYEDVESNFCSICGRKNDYE
ncbi:DUF1642 domain-containing protein [Lactococcus petauri]|uniref:DUF1642 domain-containing protein n=1 Tax=Lactococcus petauri TaxID=1940789 RepID=UPI0022E3935B|nr:DUF1642 domain-containing protein [Lactococcus petauri]